MTEFGDAISILRQITATPRKAVAAELDVDPSHYGRLESGSRQFSAEQMKAVAKLADCSLNTFLLGVMLLRDNVQAIPEDTNDFGDLFVRWLNAEVSQYSRPREENAQTRHIFASKSTMRIIIEKLPQCDAATERIQQSEPIAVRRRA